MPAGITQDEDDEVDDRGVGTCGNITREYGLLASDGGRCVLVSDDDDGEEAEVEDVGDGEDDDDVDGDDEGDEAADDDGEEGDEDEPPPLSLFCTDVCVLCRT